MVKTVSRGTCINQGCFEPAFYKRLCRLHFSQLAPSTVVKDYCFTWNIIDSYEGVVRASSEAEALKLVKSGVAAGQRTVLGPKPCNIELVETREC